MLAVVVRELDEMVAVVRRQSIGSMDSAPRLGPCPWVLVQLLSLPCWLSMRVVLRVVLVALAERVVLVQLSSLACWLLSLRVVLKVGLVVLVAMAVVQLAVQGSAVADAAAHAVGVVVPAAAVLVEDVGIVV